jgi:phage major head subunit gpT-like protein
MEITPASINGFFQKLNFSFQSAFQQVPTFWNMIASEFPSDTEQNLYPFLSMIPGLREWIGPRVFNNVAARAFAVANKHWEASYAIDLNKFKDDTYGFYAQMQPMIAQQVAEWRDRRMAQVIEAGTTALCWDGQFFFDTDHPVDPDNTGPGTNSNKLVGATYDISGNSGDPLVAYAAARAAMALWKREDSQQLGTIGDTIMVHPNEEKYGLQIANALMTAQAVGSAAAGVSNVFSGTIAPRVIVNPYLTVTSGKPWYLLCTKRGIKPFGWQNRQDPNLVARTEVTSENIFKLRQIEWGVDLRGEALYTFPFLAFRMSAS